MVSSPEEAPIERLPGFTAENWIGFMEHVFHGWTSEDPIIMPTLPVHTFSQSSIEVGRFTQDIPVKAGSVISQNRKKNSKAYLMIKRDGDNQPGFLWCDADGKPAKRSYIKMTRGLSASRAKEDLIKKYNPVEFEVMAQYNRQRMIWLARRQVVKFAERGTVEPPVIDEKIWEDAYLKG
ncbi:hypothetical protein ACLX1H_008221 [Fusarium chlamydosporum]